MRIYACVPEEIFSDNTRRERLCSDLHRAFEGYYGKFAPSDIQFFRSDNSTVNLYVMEKSLKPEYDDKIIASARNIFACPVEVRLNYQTLNPAFKPQDAASSQRASLKGNEFDYEKLSFNYDAEEPLYTFDQVILPASTRMRINEAVAVMSHEVKQKVFEDWGLKNIVPNPASAINFYGSPGTGKTMAAEAIAKMLGKKIIRASYADIESKYHGEGPKMIKAIFLAAKREDAVLFIDEADSLLSKRMTDVTDGSAQAVNSMRSQLLISLEHFDGVVIFATNLIVNYDKAFISRLVCIEIPDPDSVRKKENMGAAYTRKGHKHSSS